VTERLEQAIAEIRKLTPDKQNTIAEIIFEELEGDRRWEALFADSRSHKFLEEMAQKVRADIKAGRVKEMGIDEL
jgi:hypothetical protein